MIARLALFASILLPASAFAYDEEVHTFLVRVSLTDPALQAQLPPIPADAPEKLRQAIDRFARTSESSVQWNTRYPEPENFDAWAMKELLLMAPEANVFGIDRLPERSGSIRDLIELGARQPDDDYRNRDRYAYDRERKKLLDADGKPIPADPALLNMGKLGALSSQAHAHYGLPQLEFSADSDVLKSEPRRFAVATGYPKGPILTLAAEMAQLHLDLALLAILSEEPNPALAWLYIGHAFHYLQDVTNQIHTVQVGIFDFFVDATIAQLSMSLRTGGGYLGELRTMPSIGIDILTNHHVISETLIKKRVVDTLAGKESWEGKQLIEAPKTDDEALKKAFATALAPYTDKQDRAPFGELLVRSTIDASSQEAAGVYASTRMIALSKYRKEGVLFDDKVEDPDSAILPENERDPEAYGRLFELQVKGFRRAGTAMRVWLEMFSRTAAIQDPALRATLWNEVADRMIRRQISQTLAVEARREDYRQNPPPAATGPVRAPVILAGEIVVLVGVALLVRWWLKRRKR